MFLTGSRRVNLALPTSDVDFVIGEADASMVSTLESTSVQRGGDSTGGGAAPTMQQQPGSLPLSNMPSQSSSRDGSDTAHALSCLHRLRERLLEKFGASVQWSLVIDAKVRV